MNDLTASVKVCVAQRARLGEGAFWDWCARRLYWVDILSGRLFIYDPAGDRNQVFDLGQSVSAVVPAGRGELLLALRHALVRFHPGTCATTVLAEPEAHIRGNRFNDGKCDPAGRFWVGTMEETGKPRQGALYCMDRDGTMSTKLTDVSISNGIVWSADARTMYYIDTGLNVIRAWDYLLDNGEIANARVCVTHDGPGHLDGMALDAEGMLWVAVFGQGRVTRYDPRDGREIGCVRLPVSQITSCSFGGEDLGDLYVTSASYEFGQADWEREPLAGSLFRVRIDGGVRGVVLPSFGG